LKEIFSGNELKKSLDSRKEKSHSSLSWVAFLGVGAEGFEPPTPSV
jgi:hypothetical protein